MIEIIEVKDTGFTYEVAYFVYGYETDIIIDIRALCQFVIYEGLNEGCSDTEMGGEHVQKEWTVDAITYIEENTEDVIRLYLANRHKPIEPSLKS